MNPRELFFKALEKVVGSLFGPKTIDPATIKMEIGIRRTYKKKIPPELKQELEYLTCGQNEYFNSILWLLDPLGSKGTGRTHMMILAFICHSLQYGTWVQLLDHNKFPQEHLEQKAEVIINRCPNLKIKIKGPKHAREILVEKIKSEPFMGFKELKPIKKDKLCQK